MRTFGKLGDKSYLDSYDDPTVWESPRLTVQMDSLLNLLNQHSDVMDGEGFELSYERTMNKKEIKRWLCFNELMQRSRK